jgi:hypothetical protein
MIFVVYSGGVSDATLVIGQVNQGVPVTAEVTLCAEYIMVGDFLLMFFVMNDLGFISEEVILAVTVDPAMTATSAESSTLTPGPPPSQTPAPSSVAESESVQPVPPAEESSTTGKISGGVVGGFLGFLAIAAIVLCFCIDAAGQAPKRRLPWTIQSIMSSRKSCWKTRWFDLDSDNLDIYFFQNANFGVDLPFSTRFDEAEQDAFGHLYQNF